MYRRQFKKWGLSKYMRAPEKDRLVQVMNELDQSFSSECYDKISGLGDSDLRKVARYINTELSKRSRRERDHRTGRAAYLNSQPLDENFPDYYSTWQHEEFPIFMSSSSSLFPTSFIVTTGNGNVDMRLLFQSVQTTCSYSIPDCNDSLAAADIFWRNLKQTIYLFRIASPTGALLSLSKAYAVAEKALLAADICSFVREILATLCPVNMRACPHLRQQIIQRLRDLAQMNIGTSHPITIVLQQLLFDWPTRDVSERCLAYLVEVATSSQDQSVLSVAIKAQLSISRLLRKDCELNDSMRISQHAHATAVATFGYNSVEACWALRQQEHICIDTGNYVEALNICFSIIGLREFYLAEIRTETEEDIAYIYEKLGDTAQRTDWLRQAEKSARQLWGDGAATLHITDKIGGLLTRGVVI